MLANLKHWIQHIWSLFTPTPSTPLLPNSHQVDELQQDCQELVQRYEELFQEVVAYLQNNQKNLSEASTFGTHALDYTEEEPVLDSFSFLNMKQDFLEVSKECERLLENANRSITSTSNIPRQLETSLSQLNELHRYSSRLKDVLNEFEDRLLSVEEHLSEHSFWN